MNSFDSDLKLWLLLLHVAQMMGRSSGDLVMRHSLTPPQFALLMRLSWQTTGAVTQQMLADELHVSKSNISQMIKILERDGWVQREPVRDAFHVSLTEQARGALNAALPEYQAYVEQVLSVFDQQEKALLLGLLRKLDHALRPPP
jgi:DNA-binding MarR family transcriptional regulator